MPYNKTGNMGRCEKCIKWHTGMGLYGSPFPPRKRKKMQVTTHYFEIVSHYFEIVSRYFEIVSRYFDLVSRYFDIVSHYFEILSHYNEILSHYFEITSQQDQTSHCSLIVAYP